MSTTFVFGQEIVYGGMYMYDQSFNLAIDILNVYHPLRGLSAGTIAGGIVFDAGSTGAVSAVANGPASHITVTSNGHGLLDGEIVYLVNSTNYDGRYVVANKTNNTFDVLATWNATRTFNWYQPATLKIPTGAAGKYRCWYNLSADAVGNAASFKCEMSFGGVSALTDIDTLAGQVNFGTGTDYHVISGSGVATLAAGDYIWMQLKNLTDTTDLTCRHCNITIQHIAY